MNAGDDGAEIDFGVVVFDRPSWLICDMPGEGGTLSERFLVFRGFLLGDSGLGPSNSGLGGTIERLLGRPFPDLNDGSAIKQSGESVDESGVVLSSKDAADSTVDIVVVGDELLEDEAEVDTLLCDLCVGGCLSEKLAPGEVGSGNGANWCVSFTDEQPDISVSKIDTKSGTVGLACVLQNGYRRFNDNDMRLSVSIAGELSTATLSGGILSCVSEGDEGFDATSV